MSCAIFLFHRIAPSADQDRWGLTVEKTEFDDFVIALKSSGTLKPLMEALQGLRAGKNGLTTALTFDDCYEDLESYAFPALRELRLAATMFPATRYVSKREPFWWEAVRSLEYSRLHMEIALDLWGGSKGHITSIIDDWCSVLKRLPPLQRDARLAELGFALEGLGSLDWPQLRDRPPEVTLGCHTHTHTVLSSLTPIDVVAELTMSSDLLFTETGNRPKVIAYPNGQPGDFSPTHESFFTDVGLEFGLTTIPGINTSADHPYRLKRIPIVPGQALAQLKKALQKQVTS